MTKMIAGQALVKVLEDWGITHIYGIPGGTINHVIEGLYQEQDRLQYIQVRHEEVGALAAVADAKFTGHISAAFGSAGPGAIHLLNGLYDAKMDHIPVLALVGQVDQAQMNTNFFQEMDELPMFNDVAVYNHQVTTAAQIPYVINQAIRAAYQFQGPAVVILPDDLSATEIEYTPTKTPTVVAANTTQIIDPQAIQTSLDLLKAAKHPLIYAGRGLMGARDELVQFSEQFNLPVVNTVPATGILPTRHANAIGTTGRLGSKPGFEAVQNADLILFLGSEFPFAGGWPKTLKIIQVNNNAFDIGKTVPIDEAVIGDAKTYLRAMIATKETLPETAWLRLNRQNKQNWENWLAERADDETNGLAPEAVMQQVASMVGPNDLFGVDTGNVSEWAVRGLPLNQNQRFAISGLYAAMGFGLPAGIAGALSRPDAQSWTFSGDGGFAMGVQDLITAVKYKLPTINVVFTNTRLGFIYEEQLENQQHLFGVELADADWAKVAEAMGAIGFTVRTKAEVAQVFDQIETLQDQGNQKPIVVNAIINREDPIRTGNVPLDPAKNDAATIAAYAKASHLDVTAQPSLGELLAAHDDH